MAEEGRGQGIALALVALGIAARAVLACFSWGTHDVDVWLSFGRQISERGVIALYHADPSFNHPPLMGCFAAFALWLSRGMEVPFPLLFKIPSILADAMTCALLWKIGLPRVGPWIAAIFAWDLNSILVSAHHCNTDSIYVMLCLASVYLIESRGAHLLGGLLLGAAINVKLIPVVLLIPMFALCRDRKSLMRFSAGLAIGSISFWPVLILAGRDYGLHALGYASFVDNWGIELFLQKLARSPGLSMTLGPSIERYRQAGRVVVFAVIWLMSLSARRRGWNRYVASASAASIFLIVTPGFGIQYTAFAAPLILAASPLWGLMYVIAASALALCWYGLNWDGTFPITNPPGIQLHGATMLAGLATWAVLMAFVVRTICRARVTQSRNPQQLQN